MEKKELQPMPINSLHYFNAHTRSDEDVQRTFIVRKHVLNEIMTGIANEPPDSIAQHYMVVGSRGMGKSTLLKMLEIELRTGALKERFIPVLFPEEQYNLDRLSKFWLNCLDALADTFEQEQNETETEALDQLIRALEKSSDENVLADQAFDAVIGICKRYNRRPVLLVDNIDILFDGITEDQQFKLRKEITQNGAPIFVGASTRQPDDSQNYDAAFYDAFDNIYLENLSRQELRELLTGLAIATGKEESLQAIYTHQAQLAALHRLSGGNPRVTAFIFQLIANGLSDQIFDNLNLLLDLVTPLYKANFEQMAKQAQVIVDGLALHWDPCDLDTLSKRTRISKDQLASQLNRLIKSGWVERSSRFSTEKLEIAVKNKNYSIRERFFNIWYIMRRASRRQRGELRSLTCFLETFYTGEHLMAEKLRIMDAIKNSPDADKVIYGLALARAHERDVAMNEMEKDIYRKVIEKEDGDLKKIATYLDPGEIPEELIHAYVINNKDWVDYLDELELNREYVKATSFIEAVLVLFPNEAYVWGRAGIIYTEVEEIDKAEKAYYRAIQLDESDEFFWNKLGELKRRRKDYRSAREFFEKAIELNQTNSIGWGSLAYMVLSDLDNIDEAEQIINEAIEKNVQDYFLWSMLANIYDQTERKEQAEDAFSKSMSLDPNNINMQFYYADLLRSHGKYEEAVKVLDNVLQKQPKNVDALELKGVINQYEFEEIDIAEHCYKMVIEYSETSVVSWVGLGTIYAFYKNMFNEAIVALERALALDGKESKVWGLYGWLLMLHYPKETEKAQIAFEKALAIKSDDCIMVSNLVHLLRDKVGDLGNAKKILEERLLPLANFDVVKKLHHATFALYDDNWGIASAHWKQVLSMTPETISNVEADVWYRSISIAQKLGYGEKLVALWKQEGADERFRPLYEALKALEYGSEGYLLNVAEEIREPAGEIYEYMKRYQQTA